MCCFACRDQPISYVGAKASRHVCPRTVRNVPRRFSDHAGGPLCAPGCVDVKQMGPCGSRLVSAGSVVSDRLVHASFLPPRTDGFKLGVTLLHIGGWKLHIN